LKGKTKIERYEKPHDISVHGAWTKKKTFWHRSKQHINEIQSLDGDALFRQIGLTVEVHVDLTDSCCYTHEAISSLVSTRCQSLSFALRGPRLKGNNLKADSNAQKHTVVQV